MNLHERYLNGETKAVYDDINKLGSNAFDDFHRKEVEKVMKETFERVSFNLNIIYKELISIGYLFKTDFKFNFEKPLHSPLDNTELLIERLELAVKDFGFIPLSLKYFYQIVGGVNFVWDFETNDEFMWEMADPIQVSSLDSIVEEVTTDYWKEDIQQYVDDEDFGCAFLDLSADDLHKDNVSGGQPYAMEITREPSVDSRFMNEPNETTFINYLRICFENCGFPGITRSDIKNDYQAFFDKVKPQLKKI
ncbi:hypothetical protein [Flavobacterium sp.]